VAADTRIVNAMSIDVEDYFHVAALAGSIDRARWNDMEYRVVENTRRLLDLFDEQRVRSTFFVLGWVAQRSPHLIREIHASEKAEGAGRIYVPGEIEFERREKAIVEGIDLPDDVVSSLRALGAELGMDVNHILH